MTLACPEIEKFQRNLEKKAGFTKTVMFTGEQREKALEAWTEAIKTDDFDRLTRREIRILCSQSSVIRSPEIRGLLKRRQAIFTPSILMPFQNAFHETWKTNENHILIRDFLAWFLRRYNGRNRKLLAWKEHQEFLLAKEGPAQLAPTVIHKGETLEITAERYYFSATSQFAEALRDEVVGQLLKRIIQVSHTFNPVEWTYLFSNFIETTQFDTLSKLILLVDNYPAEAREQGISFLQRWFLASNAYGDPRISPGKWVNIEARAREAFVGWLSQADIELFFNMIIKNDTQKRKRFWLRYLKCIKGSTIAIGPSDNSANTYQLSELKKEGYYYASLEKDSSHNSAFILDFGKYVIVDFSRVGCAYLYEKDTFLRLQNNAQSIYTGKNGKTIGSFDVRSLKNPTLAKESVPHHQNIWLDNLSNVLAAHGIRP